MEESRNRPTKRDDKHQVMDVIREDRRLTVREVGYMLGIGKSSIKSFYDYSKCAKDPLLLNEDQKQYLESYCFKGIVNF